jgi:hypothetical protein
MNLLPPGGRTAPAGPKENTVVRSDLVGINFLQAVFLTIVRFG